MTAYRLRRNMKERKNLFITLTLPVLFLVPLACGGGGGGTSSPGGPTIPQVVQTIPADGATSVSTTITAEIHFSEAMSEASVEDNIFMGGYAGSPDSYWNTGSTILYTDFSTAPLDTNTTYTITIFSNAEDQEGDKLAAPVNFALSTGLSLATGSISGTISHDPDSDYDNSLGNTAVAVSGSDFFGTGDSAPIVIIQADAAGSYSVGNLEDGTYYVIAVQETTGDEINPNDGDSLGVYRDVLAYASSAVAVTSTVNAVSGVDFTLHDPEAITGDVIYAGANTGSLGSVFPVFFVYTGDLFWTGDLFLTNELSSSEVADYRNTYWSYSLNPFLDSSISVQGVYDTGYTATGSTSITPGTYQVLVAADLGITVGVGFASNPASIADTGADAPGIDVAMYDTYTINGEVRASDINTNPLYQGARVTLLDWPFRASFSDTWGEFALNNSPVGLPVAFHTEPLPADAGSYYTVNSQFRALSMSDFANTTETSIVSRNLVAELTSLCGATIDSSEATGGGAIWDSTETSRITGATVTISAPSTVYYFSSPGPTCDTTPPTQDVPDGFPQYIFQATPPLNEKSTVAVAHSTLTFDDVTIPVRAGELTTVDLQAN